MLYFMLYTIAFVCFVANTAIEIGKLSAPKYREQDLDDAEDLFWVVGVTLGGLSQVMFYILLMTRLYHTFEASAYSVPRYYCYGYSIAIGFTFLFGLLYLASVEGEVYYMWRVTFLSITGGMFICIRLSLIWVFVTKLMNVSAQQQAVVHPLTL